MVSTTIRHQGWIGLIGSIAEIVDRIGIGIGLRNEGQVILHFPIRNGSTGAVMRLQYRIGGAEAPARIGWFVRTRLNTSRHHEVQNINPCVKWLGRKDLFCSPNIPRTASIKIDPSIQPSLSRCNHFHRRHVTWLERCQECNAIFIVDIRHVVAI